jgi:hypothetical protein
VLKKNCFGATKFTKVKIILILKYWKNLFANFPIIV